MSTKYIYLHGFGSGPQSVKANFFKKRLESFGIGVEIPDLNVPDFEHLSFERMVDKVKEMVKKDKSVEWVLIGASLGALVALKVASEEEQIKKVIMLAPAIGFSKNIARSIGVSNIKKWKQDGVIQFDHSAYQKKMSIHYDFIEELRSFDEYKLFFDTPVTIFHGAFDETIRFEWVEEFTRSRSNVMFHLLEADHSLHTKLEWIWRELLKSELGKLRHAKN